MMQPVGTFSTNTSDCSEVILYKLEQETKTTLILLLSTPIDQDKMQAGKRF